MSTCAINRCDRPQGLGTHVQIKGNTGTAPRTGVTVPICEPHWEAIRAVPYLRDEPPVQAPAVLGHFVGMDDQ